MISVPLNPFLFPTICNFKKYVGKNKSFEKLMFDDYPYLEWSYENLKNSSDRGKIGILLELGEKMKPVGNCKGKDCTNIVQKICFYRANYRTSAGRSVNTDFRGFCSKCARDFTQRSDEGKHQIVDIKFSSALSFDTVTDRKSFMEELKYCLGGPSQKTNEAAVGFFHKIFDQVYNNFPA